MNLSGQSTTELAARLAPPVLPQPPNRWGCIALIVVPLVLIFGLPFLAVIPFLLVQVQSVQPPDAPIRLVLGVSVVVIAAAELLAVLVGLPLLLRRNGKRARRKYEIDLHAYRCALGLWQELYYCARSDGVFWQRAWITASPKTPGLDTLQGFEQRLIPLDQYWATLWNTAYALEGLIDPNSWDPATRTRSLRAVGS